MQKEIVNLLRCPKTLNKLILKIEKESNTEILEGILTNQLGDNFPIQKGIIDFTEAVDLKGVSKVAREQYEYQSITYDENVNITFQLYNEKEEEVRNYLVNLLNLKQDSNVLEISSGTGLDSEIIIKKLSEKGSLTTLDISPDMVEIANKRLKDSKVPVNLTVGDACSLPFSDNSFDALFCFAGIGHFEDMKKALNEMARVVKVGGKVVFCEKNVPAWLVNTTYGKILINNNPMFEMDNPLELIPVQARNVGIRWILGNVHYVVDYEVGEGEPVGNFDLEIPGARGGTFNSRYYGKLEGVSEETKKLIYETQQKTGLSVHKWLDKVLKEEALKVLKQNA